MGQATQSVTKDHGPYGSHPFESVVNARGVSMNMRIAQYDKNWLINPNNDFNDILEARCSLSKLRVLAHQVLAKSYNNTCETVPEARERCGGLRG